MTGGRAAAGAAVAVLVAGLVAADGPHRVLVYHDAMPTTLNPLFASTMSDVRADELIFDRLVYASAVSSELRSRLLVENAAGPYIRMLSADDGREVTLAVRDDVRWHDGEPFTAEDVCFTIDAIIANPHGSIALPLRNALSGCRVAADGAFVVTFDRPLSYGQRLAYLAFSVLPKHAFPGGVVTRDAPFGRHPIGTGPMRAEMVADGVRFSAFPNGNHAPHVARMRLVADDDPDASARDVVSGAAQLDVNVPIGLRREVEASGTAALVPYDVKAWWFVALNTHRGALGDLRVREALDRAIDRERLLTDVVGIAPSDDNPPGEVVTGPFVMSSPYYNRALKAAPADPDRVRERMTAAGAHLDGGRWVWTDGRPLRLRLGIHAAVVPEAPTLTARLAAELAEAGFDVDVDVVSDQTWRDDALAGRLTEYDLLVGAWSFPNVEDLTPLFHTRDTTGQRGADNLFDYSNPDVDALLDQRDAATTAEEGRSAYQAVHALLAEDRPYLFLWKLDSRVAMRDGLRGDVLSPYYCFTEFDGWQFTP